MKRTSILFALAFILLAGCKQESKDSRDFATQTISGKQCYQMIFDKEKDPWGIDFNTKVTYSVAWPNEGLLSPSALRELQYLYFMDSTSSFDDARKNWLAMSFFYEDEFDCEKKAVDSIDEASDYSYMNLEGTYTEDSMLVTFIITTESFIYGAAHGMYSLEYLTIDKESGNAIHLADLVTDTNLLCEAIAHAIQDLDVNGDTRECLFDEFRNANRMPMPQNFVIDSARNSITVIYSLYEITPYACGIQSVVLPIFWLSKHVPLTPYAKRLFGEGCSID